MGKTNWNLRRQAEQPNKPMRRWFAAHIVMYFKFHDGRQDCFPIYEDVVLFRAKDPDAARALAEKVGILGEDPTCKHAGRAATLTFAGVRKVISCEFPATPGSGQEATYSQFTVNNEAELQRFIEGESVSVEYVE